MPSCPGCGQTVYPHDKPAKACGGEWHPGCLKCTQCKITLNLTTFQSYNNQPYCKAHVPKDKPTAFAVGAPPPQRNPSGSPSRGPPGRAPFMGAPAPNRGSPRSAVQTQYIGAPERIATPLASIRGPGPQRGPPMRGPPGPGRGAPSSPGRSAPPGRAPPGRSWKLETENPPSMGPGRGSAPARSGPPPQRSSFPPQKSSGGPPQKSSFPPQKSSGGPPQKSSGGPPKKWNIEAQSSVPHSGQTFKPSGDPSKVATNVSYSQPVSKTPFKPTVEHKAEMKRLSMMPKKQTSMMEKQTNVGKQPVGIMYSSSDSEDEERAQLYDAFAQMNYHKGGSDQSTENNPENRTISYESRGIDQSTENNPHKSNIRYTVYNPDQSTENNPTPSAYNQYQSEKPSGGGRGAFQKFQQPSYDEPQSNDGGYGGDSGYNDGGYNEGGGDTYTEQSYEDNSAQSYDQGGYSEQTYDDGGGYAEQTYDDGGGYAEQSYDESGYGQSGEADQGYTEGSYDESGYGEAQYDQGGYAEGGYDENSYAEGGYAEGGYAEGGYDENGEWQ